MDHVAQDWMMTLSESALGNRSCHSILLRFRNIPHLMYEEVLKIELRTFHSLVL